MYHQVLDILEQYFHLILAYCKFPKITTFVLVALMVFYFP